MEVFRKQRRLRPYFQSNNSSNSISMLPSEPKIFHGRDSELSDILQLFETGTPRIAILGGGGMGKSSLVKALLHHPTITAKYEQNRFFVACNSATTGLELVALIGAHLGLKPEKDLTRPVLKHFSSNPSSLLILDELETLWEPAVSRSAIEEVLSLLAGVNHLALMITMRGAERPAKVQWTRPFFPPLKPLDQDAARLTFIDIADNGHTLEEVDRILSLTDNMPLAINLLAHLADSEGCSNVLSQWEKEKTALISDGFDKRSNLDLSISLSLSSPRIKLLPQSQELLSLLSILPDGLLDVDLIQSKLPLESILGCKTALKSTALAYSDENKRLKVLMPVREYMQQHWPPGDHLVQILLKYFHDLLEFFAKYRGTQSSATAVPRIVSNSANIQNLLQWGFQREDSNFLGTTYCLCYFNLFSRIKGQTHTHLIGQLHNILPHLSDHTLQVRVITELLNSWGYYEMCDPGVLIPQGLEHCGKFTDPDVKCSFYIAMTQYYSDFKPDYLEAIKMCKRALSLAISTGYTKGEGQALNALAWIDFLRDKYLSATSYAHQGQRLARVSGNIYGESQGARMEAIFWRELGHYKKAFLLCIRARYLLGLCDMSGSETNVGIMDTEAACHVRKSEYDMALKIYTKMLLIVSVDQSPYLHAVTLINVAEVQLLMGAPKDIVERSITLAQSIFTGLGMRVLVTTCEVVLAALYLREKDLVTAKLLFEKFLKFGLSSDNEFLCLKWLGNAGQWGPGYSMSRWTTIFLIHSVKFKKPLEVHKALQFLGDVFLHQGDKGSAMSLFTVALEGFTYMDVHQSRAECMLRLGDIAKGCGDLLKAMTLWNMARPLFECSSQAQQVEHIDHRIASASRDVQLQHRKSITHLAELNAPSSTCMVEEVEVDEDDIENIESMVEDKRDQDPVSI
ncbi:hypothetical protein B0H14DRAFT_1346649 [Mycena olivaceomarginata]|nr:hypothetical protein B0H14DRAFT_1346649 [Mycena olivaceomarginata]